MKISSSTYLIIGSLLLLIASITAYKIDLDTTEDFLKWILRVVVSLAASMVSYGIPGTIEIKYQKEVDKLIANDGVDKEKVQPTLADKGPTIVATGAIAVFVLVYLFNPL